MICRPANNARLAPDNSFSVIIPAVKIPTTNNKNNSEPQLLATPFLPLFAYPLLGIIKAWLV